MLDEWVDTPPAGARERRHFFVSEGEREPWHVESQEDCELMLCGIWIPVEGPGSGKTRVQTWWGPKKCPDCFLLFGKLEGRLP